MTGTLRRAWFRIRQWLNSDSVIPFVWVYYIWLFTFGILATVIFDPTGVVDRQLGRATYHGWVATCVMGTASVMLGLILRHGSTSVDSMTGRQLFSDWFGLWMQWGGHAGMFLVLLAFEIAGLSDPNQRLDPFVLFAIAPYVQGCFILWLTTSMKLTKAARL